MTIHSERFDLDMPDDFPMAVLERIQDQLSEPEERRERDEWREWAGACNGILYRFRACAEHSDLLRASLAASTSPPQPERYEQEKLLFDFFAEGLSAVDCLYYGAYFIGALIDAEIDSGVDRPKIEPAFVTRRFEVVFPDEAIAANMREVLGDAEFGAWRKGRNILTHRAAPGRDFRMGGDDAGTYWLGGSLDGESFLTRRAWLASMLTKLLGSLDDLVSKRLD